MASSLRSFARADEDAVVELSRRARGRPEEQVGNPLWTTREELESELSDWDLPPEETLFVEEEDGRVVAFGGAEIAHGWDYADLFGPLVAPGYKGQRLGTQLLDATIRLTAEHGAAHLIASVGVHNLGGRLLLEHAGFSVRGPAKAVFRLDRREHRPRVDGPAGVEVRAGTSADLTSALALYHETFPEGVFPDESWRTGLAKGAVYLAERDGRPLAFLNIDPADRWAYQIGVVAAERSRGVGSYLLARVLEDYWTRHPGDRLGLEVEADNLPALRLLRRQGFAPELVLQSYELRL